MMLDICDKAKENSSFGVKQQWLTNSLLDIWNSSVMSWC